MSVLVETSAGALVIDLFVEDCPVTCLNFVKLCKLKFFHGCLFYNVQHNYIAQTGDPSGTGEGGASLFARLGDEGRRFFPSETRKHLKHNKIGLVSMATKGPDANGSQFFFTTRAEDMEHLDGVNTVFGQVEEGLDVLETINSLYCDEDGRPYQDVRIRHTYVLDDPFDDPPNFPEEPPSPIADRPPQETVQPRIPFEQKLDEYADGRTAAEIEESIRAKEAKSRAVVLEMIGDIPDADIKAPDNVLFVCKLNPVTTDEDLEVIFARFGVIKSCEIIRDPKTGDSLNYAFVEFEDVKACLEAYFKMNNVLIDDRRIKVDFSQSVAKLWNKYAMKPYEDRKVKGDGPATGRVMTGGSSRLQLKSSAVDQIRPGNQGYDLVHGEDEMHIEAAAVERADRDRFKRKGYHTQSGGNDRHAADDRKDTRDRDRDRHRDERDDRRDRDRDRSRRDKERSNRDRERERERDRSRERHRDRGNSRDRKHRRDRERSRSRSRERHSRR